MMLRSRHFGIRCGLEGIIHREKVVWVEVNVTMVTAFFPVWLQHPPHLGVEVWASGQQIAWLQWPGGKPIVMPSREPWSGENRRFGIKKKGLGE